MDIYWKSFRRFVETLKDRSMKKAEFLQMVKNELDTIKAKATKEEIGRLDFSKFEHYSGYDCIYGQMTGLCNSKRAKELMPKVFNDIVSWDNYERYVSFSKQLMKKGNNYTALEKYLYMVKAPMHEKIIKYLKGEISEITLS